MTERRLSEKIDALLGQFEDQPDNVLIPPSTVRAVIDTIVEHVEALEDVTSVEVVTDARTVKGPPGPTTS